MNFIQRFIYKQAFKAAGRDITLLPSWRRWFPMRGPEFSQLVEEAYTNNPTVFACQLILALTFPEPELWAWTYDKRSGEYLKVTNHPLRGLLAKPNPDMGEAELYKFVITYAPLGGSVFLWKQRDRAGRVMGLWPFHRGQMQPIPGRNTAEGLVAYFVLDTGEHVNDPDPFRVGRYEMERGVAIPKADVIHWRWMIDPERPWDGLSALTASAGDIDTRNEIRNLVYSLLKNDATPPLVIIGAEGDELTDEKVERLGAQWTQKYGGQKRGRPAFLEYGMDVKQLAFSLEQLSFSTLQDGPDAAVCMGYHIHPTVVGAMIGLKSSTYNNQAEAREALAVDTNTPLWRSFASEVQQSMADEPGYGRELKIAFDLQQVRALQESQDVVEKRLRSGLDAGAITRAEYRRRLGFQTTPADDVYKESLAMIWVQQGTVRETDAAMLEGGKYFTAKGTKGAKKIDADTFRALQKVVDAQRSIRLVLAGRMSRDVDDYFEKLGNEVLRRVGEKSATNSTNFTKGKKEDEWTVDDFVQEEDGAALGTLLKRYYLEVLTASWDILNIAVDSTIQFDENDPNVTRILAKAGGQVKDILETTRQEVAKLLQTANEEGWSVDQIAKGVRDLVVETYKNRAKTIARTELGTAQNEGALYRFEKAGAKSVLVFDNGLTDDDEPCQVANGAVWSLEKAAQSPLEHPNCTRAFGALFDA